MNPVCIHDQIFTLIGSIPSFSEIPCVQPKKMNDLQDEFKRYPNTDRIINNTLKIVFCPPRQHNLTDDALRFYISTQALKVYECAFENAKSPFVTQPDKYTHLHIVLYAALKVEELLLRHDDFYLQLMWKYTQFVGIINYLKLFEQNDYLISSLPSNKYYSNEELTGCMHSIYASNTLLCKEPDLKFYVIELLTFLDSEFNECTQKQRRILHLMCALYIQALKRSS